MAVAASGAKDGGAKDASPRPTAADSIERSPEVQLRTFQELATDILSRLDPEATLLSILNAATGLVDSDIAGILLNDGDGVRMRACTGHHTVATARLYVGRGQGVAGRVFETGEPFKVDDYETDDVISRHFVQIAREEGKRSALGAPLRVRGETAGVLMVWRRRPSTFTDGDVEVLSSLGNLAAIAIVNADLYDTQRQALERLEVTNEKLATQNDALRRSSELHEELTSIVLEGSDLFDVAAVVARHSNGPAAILDPELTVLAETGEIDGVSERISGQLASNQQSGAEVVATSVVPPGEGHDGWLLFRTVFAAGEVLGYVCVELPQPPQNHDPLVVEQAATVCALHQVNQQAIWEAKTRLHADLLWDLLDGNVHDEAEALVRADQLGQTLPETLRVFLVEIKGGLEWAKPRPDDVAALDRRSRVLARTVEHLAKDAGSKEAFAAQRGPMIGALIDANNDPDHASRIAVKMAEGLARAHPSISVSVGVSACTDLQPDLQSACAQAERALSAVPLKAGPDRVAVFDDLGLLRFLLGSSERPEIARFAQSILGPVLDYDREHSINLVATLDAFLSEDCNLQRSAEVLFVHSKTVRYRLDRIQELSGLDLSRQQDRFNAQLALSMIKALSLDSEENPAGDSEAEPDRSLVRASSE